MIQSFLSGLVCLNSIIQYCNSWARLGQDLVLFKNKEILIDQKTFFSKSWFQKGIFRIHDLLTRNGTFLSHVVQVWFKMQFPTVFTSILQWIIMASLTYVCFVPAKGLVRDLSANSSNIAFEVPLASKWWWQYLQVVSTIPRRLVKREKENHGCEIYFFTRKQFLPAIIFKANWMMNLRRQENGLVISVQTGDI